MNIDTHFPCLGGDAAVCIYGDGVTANVSVSFFPDGISRRETEVPISEFSSSLADMIKMHSGQTYPSWMGLSGAAEQAAQLRFAKRWAEHEIGQMIHFLHVQHASVLEKELEMAKKTEAQS